MKKIVTTIPPFLFSFLFLLPFIAPLISSEETNASVDFSQFKFVSFVIYALWISSIVEYMCEQLRSSRFRFLSHAITGLVLVVQISFYFFQSESFSTLKMERAVSLITSLLIVVNGFVVSSIIKKVFYARTPWFLFLELIAFPIGMYTLTGDIRKWDIEKR